jgi:hypothetical protein
MMVSRCLSFFVLVAFALASVACGEDANSGTASADTGTPDMVDTLDASEPDPSPVVQPDPVPDATPDPQDVPEPEPEPDVTEPEPDVVEDVVDEDIFEGSDCVDDEDCPENYSCLDEVCVLNPEGRAYVEFNYVLEEPSELTNTISVLKGFFSDVGFFLIDFSPLDEANESEMFYGGAERVLEVEDGPDVWTWQLPLDLPSVQVYPDIREDDPLNGRRWTTDPFTYELVAIFGEFRLGFEAVDAVVSMEFSEDLSQVVSGRLTGYITREEVEGRGVDFTDNCLLATGLCPAFDCVNDPPWETLAEVFDCLEIPLNADIDPNLEGDDAYDASIFFQSEQVIIQE